MTSDRPYRPQLPQEVAIERLRGAVGVQFDPIVVEELACCISDYDASQPRKMNLAFLDGLGATA
jgi:HD-GYP domain-containing protein (c-di-GMP phosphodiesterase class II)